MSITFKKSSSNWELDTKTLHVIKKLDAAEYVFMQEQHKYYKHRQKHDKITFVTVFCNHL